MRSALVIIVSALLASGPISAAAAQSADVPAPVATPANAPAPAAPPTQKTAKQEAADRQNEIVCRREREIASLVKTKKTCHTRAQWAYIHSETSRIGQDFVAANRAQSNGGN